MTARKTTSKNTVKDTVKDTGDDLIASPAEPITVDPQNVNTYDSAPPAAPVMTSPTVPVEVVEEKGTQKKRTASSTSKKTSN